MLLSTRTSNRHCVGAYLPHDAVTCGKNYAMPVDCRQRIWYNVRESRVMRMVRQPPGLSMRMTEGTFHGRVDRENKAFKALFVTCRIIIC